MPPAMGRMAARHAWQTGRREMLVKGVPQRRQSEGKRVAKRLSATTLIEETRMDTSEPPRGATLVPVVRIGSPLLLKTNLPSSPGTAKAASRRISLSIAGGIVPGNDSTVRPSQAVPISIAAVLALGRT